MRMLLIALALAGCGIKGDPLPVEPAETSVTISGSAGLGVTYNSGG